MKQKSLRAWLRREPVPDAVTVRLEDGEERKIHIPGDIRNRWKTVEASVLASNAVAVTLLDKKDVVLRSQELEHDPDEDEDNSPEAAVHKAQARTMKDWTAMLQAVMHEQNTSFDKGVAAASQSQESLVEVVETIAQHFAVALTNVHNIVSNMAVMQQQHAEAMAKATQRIAELSTGDGEDGHGKQIAQLLVGALVPGAGAASAAAAAAAPAANGKAKK